MTDPADKNWQLLVEAFYKARAEDKEAFQRLWKAMGKGEFTVEGADTFPVPMTDPAQIPELRCQECRRVYSRQHVAKDGWETGYVDCVCGNVIVVEDSLRHDCPDCRCGERALAEAGGKIEK